MNDYSELRARIESYQTRAARLRAWIDLDVVLALLDEVERLRGVEAVVTKVRDWWDRTDVIAARRTDLSREEDALWEELDAALSIPEVSA